MVTPEGVFVMMLGMAASVMWLHQSNRNNGLKDIQAFIEHLQMHVYSISRSLAKEQICTRIETEGKHEK